MKKSVIDFIEFELNFESHVNRAAAGETIYIAQNSELRFQLTTNDANKT